MSYKAIIAALALAQLTVAVPLTPTTATVQTLPALIKGPTTSALTAAPMSLPTDEKAFLDKYQPLSNAASTFIGSKDRDNFTSAGLCFSEYPCFSVEAGATVGMGSPAPITQVQMAGLLDKIAAMPVVNFNKVNNNTQLNGFQVTSNGVVFEVVSAPSMMPSNVMAGIAFDLYKMQGGSPGSNSIRGLLAGTDAAPNPHTALCLYPAGVSANMASNFCVGKEPSGAKVATLAKRGFSLDGLLTGFCGFLDVPLLCPSEI